MRDIMQRMTRSTAETIIRDSKVHAASLGPMPNGQYGVYIGTYNERQPVMLLTSDGCFKTAEEAQDYGETVISNLRTHGYQEK